MKIKKTVIIPTSLTLFCLILHILFNIFQSISDIYNSTIGSFFRMLLAALTNLLPFSLAELLTLSFLPLSVFLAVFVMRKKESRKIRLLQVGKIIAYILATIYILFVLTFASGYSSSPIEQKFAISRKNISANELYETMLYVVEKVNETADSIVFDASGASVMPYDHKHLSELISESYKQEPFSSRYNSRVKPLLISPIMTYTHISGIYSFFTGEANINTNFPDYVCAFSSAHEMAHQRGISREDEANFTAYIICIKSNDEYLQYSGYLSMYGYLSSALAEASPELYKNASKSLCPKAKEELAAYSRFFEKYSDNTVSMLSDVVNDTYLKAQGTEGIRSYGMVVDLAVAYHTKNDNVADEP